MYRDACAKQRSIPPHTAAIGPVTTECAFKNLSYTADIRPKINEFNTEKDSGSFMKVKQIVYTADKCQ